MSFAVPATAPRARPSTVTIAATCLFVAAGIEVISTVIALLYAQKIVDGTKKIYDDAGVAQGTNVGSAIGSTVGVIFGFLIILCLVLLGYFISRGNQAARVVTWVIGGIVLCCSGVGLGGTLLTSSAYDATRKNNSSLPTYDEFQKMVYSEVPGWYRPVTMLLSVLLFLAIVVAIIALALPASHPYFRKPVEQWEPPVPGSGGPGYPGYPQPGQPGQPGYGGPPTA